MDEVNKYCHASADGREKYCLITDNSIKRDQC